MSIKSSLKAALPVLAILLNSGSQVLAADGEAQAGLAPLPQQTAQTIAPGATAPAPSALNRAYFLHIEGRALPLKQALVNGVNVLGGAVVSLSLPVNISGYTRPGLNTVQIDYVSDPKSNLVVAVEKRTPGPKTEELVKITAAAGESKGEPKSASVSFNLADDGYVASIGELKDLDKASIAEEFTRYYHALASTRADQVRALYRQSLADERRLCPESAKFFENVLSREVAILKNKDLKLNPLNPDGLAFKIEGDSVKLYRQNSKPLIESNEVDAQIAPILIEVSAEKDASGNPIAALPQAAKSRIKHKQAKQNKKKEESLKSSSNFAKAIEIPTSAFLPVSQNNEQVGLETKAVQTIEATSETPAEIALEIPIIQPADSKPLQVRASDGTIAATEIKIGEETTVFDGSKPAASIAATAPTATTGDSDRHPPKTAVKERLVRFNLYFKPSRPDSAGRRTWVVSLPPNT